MPEYPKRAGRLGYRPAAATFFFCNPTLRGICPVLMVAFIGEM
ncbi:Hypothetical protein RAK1035_3147 [Roseovarius sp. AK1035]|nr:Hypothetical protein RAK1035_3147 [Roseovarius sp. AK1035]